MQDRSIKDSFNSSSLENVSIQSDILNEYGLSEKDFDNLEVAINEAEIGEMAKEQNQLYLEKLKKSINEHEKEQAKKFLGWIKNSIGNVSSVITIASVL
ncbi:hypothetical protein [Salinicoccus roseus]|uniref:hypothetical protein n=1 Tax=Salinicoccus roseus TaxID=45670 RepID=UPI001EF50FCE|nr:hypothetical protein [Salinicoccus roseus]MCG7332148.1 hypothetical protein [Salinicoccus roseus]